MTERAIFDLRLEVEAESEEEIMALAAETRELVNERGPEGVFARWYALRPAKRSRSFVPTIVPNKGKGRIALATLIAQVDAEGDDA